MRGMHLVKHGPIQAVRDVQHRPERGRPWNSTNHDLKHWCLNDIRWCASIYVEEWISATNQFSKGILDAHPSIYYLGQSYNEALRLYWLNIIIFLITCLSVLVTVSVSLIYSCHLSLILGTLQGIAIRLKIWRLFSWVLQLRLHAQSYLYSDKFALDIEKPRPYTYSHDLQALFVWIRKVHISDIMEN